MFLINPLSVRKWPLAKKMPRASALAPQAVSVVGSLFINRVHRVDTIQLMRDDVSQQLLFGPKCRWKYLLQILYQTWTHTCGSWSGWQAQCLSSLSTRTQCPKLTGLPPAPHRQLLLQEGWKEKENKTTFVSTGPNYLPWIWHPSINWYSAKACRFKMCQTTTLSLKLIEICQSIF